MIYASRIAKSISWIIPQRNIYLFNNWRKEKSQSARNIKKCFIYYKHALTSKVKDCFDPRATRKTDLSAFDLEISLVITRQRVSNISNATSHLLLKMIILKSKSYQFFQRSIIYLIKETRLLPSASVFRYNILQADFLCILRFHCALNERFLKPNSTVNGLMIYRIISGRGENNSTPNNR